MRNKIEYEWDVEERDEYADIIDHNFSETLAKIGFDPETFDAQRFDLVLVRYVGNEDEGVLWREWCYALPPAVAGKWILPDEFDGGSEVPKRFHREFERWTKGETK